MKIEELHKKLGEMRELLLKKLEEFPPQTKHAAAMYVLNILRNEIKYLSQVVGNNNKSLD